MERSRDLGPYRQARSMKGALKVWLDVAYGARANRGFLGRAVRYLAGEAGIRQFLDIGTGIPTAGNTNAWPWP